MVLAIELPQRCTNPSLGLRFDINYEHGFVDHGSVENISSDLVESMYPYENGQIDR